MGKFTRIPARVYKNGLYDVPRILEDIKIGKNSGEKLVAVLKLDDEQILFSFVYTVITYVRVTWFLMKLFVIDHAL
nr:CNT_HP1_G0006290.mRNA.1.CDS.1 [Saccharomyces cerevisiae]